MSQLLDAGMLTWALVAVLTALALFSAGHALLNHRDPRSAIGWMTVSLFLPGLGPLSYWVLGVNRIRIRGQQYQARWRTLLPRQQGGSGVVLVGATPAGLIPDAYGPLVRTAGAVTRRPLLPGNHVRALYAGEEAYPAMLEAIQAAQREVYLSSYIFASDEIGCRFAQELAAAAERGVDVRVLLDGIGNLLYSRPRAQRLFRGTKVRFAEFLPVSLQSRLHVNLRNHRKLLVVDEEVGFTGGMNIWDLHFASREAVPQRVVDVHFRVEGPVVLQMEEVFREDWAFATGEPFAAVDYNVSWSERPAVCRGVAAGPNEEIEKLEIIVLAALHTAREHVRIITPYFVPERELRSAFTTTTLRGVAVDIILPACNNHPLVDWASRSLLDEMVEQGVRVYYQPGPFAHTKLLLVDDEYSLVGSANLDARSLRLNFEFNLEIYDRDLTGELTRYFEEIRVRSHEVTLTELTERPLSLRLRDAAAGLLAPYL